MIIKTHDLVKQVKSGDRSLTLLNKVSLQIKPGSAVAIVGASGSGKSTLLGLLAGLDLATSGEVSLFGQSLQLLNEDQRARLRAGRVGFVFQSFQLISGLTALENVSVPLELEMRQNNNEARARTALNQVGLSQRMDHFPNQLSGGEQQRVALARAFVTQPKVLFADEPTGNLDQATGAQVIELVFERQQAQGATLVLVTHDERLASRCDTHYQLDDGKLTGI